jgi:hypothetical protein
MDRIGPFKLEAGGLTAVHATSCTLNLVPLRSNVPSLTYLVTGSGLFQRTAGTQPLELQSAILSDHRETTR